MICFLKRPKATGQDKLSPSFFKNDEGILSLDLTNFWVSLLKESRLWVGWAGGCTDLQEKCYPHTEISITYEYCAPSGALKMRKGIEPICVSVQVVLNACLHTMLERRYKLRRLTTLFSWPKSSIRLGRQWNSKYWKQVWAYGNSSFELTTRNGVC